MNTLIVSSKDFRINFPKYQKLVEMGISLTIVKRSKPIFHIEPVDVDFQNKITESLIDYETNKNNAYVSYADVFEK